MNVNETSTDPDLIARIRAARGFANLTQAGLAKRLGVSAGMTKRIERGERPLTFTDLGQIAEACGVPMDFLVNGFQSAQPVTLEALSARIDALEASLEERIRTVLESSGYGGRSTPNGS
jgi:transcriptional regulator with XRE-family HTH domain